MLTMAATSDAHVYPVVRHSQQVLLASGCAETHALSIFFIFVVSVAWDLHMDLLAGTGNGVTSSSGDAGGSGDADFAAPAEAAPVTDPLALMQAFQAMSKVSMNALL